MCKILYNKNLPFPHISLSLILSSLIISVPILFDDVLYAFLGANVGLAFPWQYLTSVFAHGPELPTIIHLLINLSIIVFCVAITEKLFGAWRVFLILVITISVLTFIRFETYNFYNGISSFIFAFAPFTLVIWLKEFKNQRKQIWSDVYSNLTLFVLFAVFILYPIYFSFLDSIFCERNILHLISTIIGVIFLVLWKKRIFEILTEINKNAVLKGKPIIGDKISRTLIYLITVLNFLVLLIVLIFFD
jgi:membrane associated rhomboid family serine protease